MTTMTVQFDPATAVGSQILALVCPAAVSTAPASYEPTAQQDTSDRVMIRWMLHHNGRGKHSDLSRIMRPCSPGYLATLRRLLHAGIIQPVTNHRGVYELTRHGLNCYPR